MAQGEPEAIDRLDSRRKKLYNIKVLPRVGPSCSHIARYLKRPISYSPGMDYEWRENPKHAMAIISNRGKEQAKPQGSPCSKEVGKSDPKFLDAMESEATEYRSDAGRVLYISSGRFDLQCAAML